MTYTGGFTVVITKYSSFSNSRVNIFIMLRLECVCKMADNLQTIVTHGCCKNLRMNIQVFSRTLSGASCSFQDHIYASVVLHHHEKTTTYHQQSISWYLQVEVTSTFLEFWKNDDSSRKLGKCPIFLELKKNPFSCILSILVKIFKKS